MAKIFFIWYWQRFVLLSCCHRIFFHGASIIHLIFTLGWAIWTSIFFKLKVFSMEKRKACLRLIIWPPCSLWLDQFWIRVCLSCSWTVIRYIPNFIGWKDSSCGTVSRVWYPKTKYQPYCYIFSDGRPKGPWFIRSLVLYSCLQWISSQSRNQSV